MPMFHADFFLVDDIVQDCSISSALALEILQSCTKSSTINMSSDDRNLMQYKGMLTHCGLMTPYGSGNGLLPDGTQPLPEPMLTDHQ